MGNAMKALENRTLDSKVRRPAALLPHTTPPHPTPLHKTPHHPIPLFTMAMHDDDDEKYPRFLTYLHTFSHTSARWTSWLHWTRCRASTRGTTSEGEGEVGERLEGILVGGGPQIAAQQVMGRGAEGRGDIKGGEGNPVKAPVSPLTPLSPLFPLSRGHHGRCPGGSVPK